MSLQFKIFRVPAHEESSEEEILNKFFRNVKVLTVYRDFVLAGADSFTIFTVEYLSEGQAQGSSRKKKGRVDYREVLSQEDFTLFARLRDWRKKAAAGEAVAVYTIFTNEQLATIARDRPRTKRELQKISGIGEAKVEKYSDGVLNIVADLTKQQRQQQEKGDNRETGRTSV